MLVDDRPMVIEGVKALLQHAENIDVVGTANDAFSTMRFLKEQKVDVVLLDINLPDLSGIVCQSTDSR